MSQANIFAAILVIICLIIFHIYTINNDDHLEGYWLADGDDFTDDAGISSMMIYIGEKKSKMFRISRECYIVIADNVANQGFIMTYSRSWNLQKNKYEITPSLLFDEDEIIPSMSTWTLNILDGTLTIAKDDIVYAKLYKQHELAAY